jgi:hypothetical protein
MTIDIDLLTRDPGFQGLAPEVQRQILDAAHTENLTGQPAPSVMDTPPQPPKSLWQRGTETVTGMGKRAILPTAGSVVGGVVGERYGEPGRQLGSAVGSVVGTGANMALGLEPWSLESLGTAAVTPVASRQTSNVLAHVLPGSAVSRLDEIANTVGGLSARVAGGATQDAADLLFKDAATSTLVFHPLETMHVTKRVLGSEELATSGLKFPRLGRVAEGLNELTTPSISTPIGNPGEVSLQQFDILRQRVGSLIGETTDSVEKGHLQQIYKGMMTDLELAAARHPEAKSLLDAIQTQKRVFAADEMQDLIDKATPRPRPGDNLQPIRVNEILHQMQRVQKGNPTKQYELFGQAVPKAELDDIVELLQEMNRKNVTLLPPGGVQHGSGPLMARGVIAGGLGKVVGLDPTAVGVAYTGVSYALSRFFLTSAGRATLRHMLATRDTLDPAQLIAEFAGQMVKPAVQETVDRLSAGPQTPQPPVYQRP